MEIAQMLFAAPTGGNHAVRRPDPPPGFSKVLEAAVGDAAPPPPPPDSSPPDRVPTSFQGEGALPTPPNADGPSPDLLPNLILLSEAVTSPLMTGLPIVLVAPSTPLVDQSPFGASTLVTGNVPTDGPKWDNGGVIPAKIGTLFTVPTSDASLTFANLTKPADASVTQAPQENVILADGRSANQLPIAPELTAAGPKLSLNTVLMSVAQLADLKPSFVASVVVAPPTSPADFDVYAEIESRSVGLSTSQFDVVTNPVPIATTGLKLLAGVPVVIPQATEVAQTVAANLVVKSAMNPPLVVDADGDVPESLVASTVPTLVSSASEKPMPKPTPAIVSGPQQATAKETAPPIGSDAPRVSGTESNARVIGTGSAAVMANVPDPNTSQATLGLIDQVDTDEDMSVESGTRVAVSKTPEAGPSAVVTPTRAAFVAPAKEIQDPAPLMRQIMDRIETMAEARPGGNVTIRLHPEDMGIVTVTLRQVGGRTEAEMSASHDPVRAALEANKGQLIQHAEQRGVNLGSVNVTATGATASTLAGGHGQSGSPESQPNPQDAARLAHLAQGTAAPVDATTRPFTRSSSARGVDFVF